MENFKFNLEETVHHKEKKKVVVGRAQYIGQSHFYMLQSVKEYQIKGFNFLKCEWVTEDKIDKIEK